MEWKIDRVVSHYGQGRKAQFLTKWSTGDETWLDYRSLADKEALSIYLELIGVETVGDLPTGGLNNNAEPVDGPTIGSAAITILSCKREGNIMDLEGQITSQGFDLCTLKTLLSMAQPEPNNNQTQNENPGNTQGPMNVDSQGSNSIASTVQPMNPTATQ